MLPWQGLRAETKKDKYNLILEYKMEKAFDRLCQGYDEEFFLYFDYCHSLRFTDTPDYEYLRGLFAGLMQRKVRRSEWRKGGIFAIPYIVDILVNG